MGRHCIVPSTLLVCPYRRPVKHLYCPIPHTLRMRGYSTRSCFRNKVLNRLGGFLQPTSQSQVKKKEGNEGLVVKNPPKVRVTDSSVITTQDLDILVKLFQGIDMFVTNAIQNLLLFISGKKHKTFV